MERANFSNMKGALKDVVPSHGANMILHRFQSFTPGTFNGQSPDRKANDLNIPIVGRAKIATQEDVLSSNGYLNVGDLTTWTVKEIIGFNSDPANKKEGDRLTYEGVDYVLKGRPKRNRRAGGMLETEAVWRMISA